MSGSTMLKLTGVTAHYGPVQALFGVDLTVGRGETVALIGANGAGKTTLLSLISGLLRPSGGTIVYQGRDLAGLPIKKLVRAGIIHAPEGRRIFTNLTVAENLEMGAYLRLGRKKDAGPGEDLNRVYDWFPALGERRKRLGGSLSGGEQQMLALGRALMGRPRLLLLDEPSLGLAPLVTAEIFKIIDRLKKRGVTILLVEQNARAALAASDRAYVMETGQVVLSGPAGELRRDESVRKAFLGQRNKGG